MMHIKKLMFENCYGEKIFFDNRKLFCEEMRIVSITGRFASESLAFAAGQVTTDYSAEAKIIQCKFALKDIRDDIFLREKIVRVFTPLRPGTITVFDGLDRYQITAYPTAVPEPVRESGVWCVWRWDMNFIADFPYFKRLPQKSKVFAAGENAQINYSGAEPSPLIVTFPATGEKTCMLHVQSGGTNNYIYITPRDKPVTVDCLTMEITDSDGADCSHYVSVDSPLDRVAMQPGKNSVYVQDQSNTGGIIVKWWEYFAGVF